MEAETDAEVLLEKLLELEDSVEDLESHLDQLLETDFSEQLGDLSELEGAKLNVTLAYAIAVVFYIYLRTTGTNPKEHPVKGELDRIKNYFRKISTAEGSYKPSMRIDKESSKRFITAALKEAKSGTPSKME